MKCDQTELHRRKIIILIRPMPPAARPVACKSRSKSVSLDSVIFKRSSRTIGARTHGFTTQMSESIALAFDFDVISYSASVTVVFILELLIFSTCREARLLRSGCSPSVNVCSAFGWELVVHDLRGSAPLFVGGLTRHDYPLHARQPSLISLHLPSSTVPLVPLL